MRDGCVCKMDKARVRGPERGRNDLESRMCSPVTLHIVASSLVGYFFAVTMSQAGSHCRKRVMLDMVCRNSGSLWGMVRFARWERLQHREVAMCGRTGSADDSLDTSAGNRVNTTFETGTLIVPCVCALVVDMQRN